MTQPMFGGLGAPRGALPSYAAGRNTFNPLFSAYNVKGSNTRRLRAGHARAASGGEADEVWLGDSRVAGAINLTGPVFDRINAVPRLYAAELALLGVPTNGTGFVRCVDGGFSDARMALSGGWSNSYGTNLVTFTNGATITLTSNVAGANVAVLYTDSPGLSGFTVSCNGAITGAGFGTVVGGAAAGLKRFVMAGVGLAAGQTVQVKVTGTAGVIIEAIEVYTPNAGLRVHNLAQSGTSAGGTGTGSWSDLTIGTGNGVSSANLWQWAPAAFATVPSCVHASLGINDIAGGLTPAQWAAGMSVVRNNYPNSDFVIHLASQPAELTPAQWAPLCLAAYTLADALDVPLIDTQDLLGGYAIENANGLSGDAVAHLNRGGYQQWSRNAALAAAA